MTQELLPCPFCGGDPDYVGSEGMGYWVQCKDCDARGPWGDYGYQALAAWNRRTSTADLQARLEAAVRVVGRMADALGEAADALDGKVENLDQSMCCSGHECGCYGSSNRDWLVYNLRTLATRTPNGDPQ